MTAQVIDFPIIARPTPARLNVHHMVTRKVEFENVIDRKMCDLAARAGCTPDEFIWGSVIQWLADAEGISTMDFIQKYLSASGDRKPSRTAERLPELNL